MKRDIKNELKHLYNPNAKSPAIVTVPSFNFLMLEGIGDPTTSTDFQSGIEVLFSLSYTIKFMVREEIDVDYGVMPLEGLWWMQDDEIFDVTLRDQWQWQIMIMQPEYVNENIISRSMEKIIKKKPSMKIDKITFVEFYEGQSMQIMHIGPFANEGPTIAGIHEQINKNGHQLSGKHHEIYLSDFRKTAPDKLKTIIRQPFR